LITLIINVHLFRTTAFRLLECDSLPLSRCVAPARRAA